MSEDRTTLERAEGEADARSQPSDGDNENRKDFPDGAHTSVDQKEGRSDTRRSSARQAQDEQDAQLESGEENPT